ncbi:MAG TPA: DUF4256 domain-containing protein [Verrucomicrobiae bacterium]|nr:DUF4256 domain-containing protein [Verrucomicrobiae bacterium]
MRARFEQNRNRDAGLAWAQVQTKLQANPQELWPVLEDSAALEISPFSSGESRCLDPTSPYLRPPAVERAAPTPNSGCCNAR